MSKLTRYNLLKWSGLIILCLFLVLIYFIKFHKNISTELTTAPMATNASLSAHDFMRFKTASHGDMQNLTWLQHPIYVGDLQFTDATNKTLSLNQIKGKILLVNIWASWCVPCRTEIPDLNHLKKLNIHPNFDVIAINIDNQTNEKAKNFLTQVQADMLALYHDPHAQIFNLLKQRGLAFGLPVTMIVNDQHYALAFVNGALKWDHADAVHLLKNVITRHPQVIFKKTP